MTKTIIAIFTITSILLFSTMMVQEVSSEEVSSEVFSSEEDIPFPVQWGGTGQAIPDWVTTQFEWYVNEEIDEKTLLTSLNWMFDNNVMHLSEKAAQEVEEMRNEINDLKLDLEITKAGSGGDITMQGSTTAGDEIVVILYPVPGANTMPGDEIVIILRPSPGMQMDPNAELIVFYSPGDPQYGNYMVGTSNAQRADDAHKEWIEILSWSNSASDDALVSLQDWPTGSSDRPTEELTFYYNKISFAHDTVDDILKKGGTASAWEDGIAAFSQHGMSESAIPELAGIVVLCNNAIDKKAQSIDAELKILEQWLEIISTEQETSSYDASDRLSSGTTAESTVQYRESDLDFVLRMLSSIDQQIMALDTGIGVLEKKLQSVGDDAQLANIDLQNQLQKQQQTLQTMSNVSKMLHDNAKAIISNMRA